MQIVTDEPLLECRVLASAVGPNREEAIRAAMAAAGVTELVSGPRPISQRTLQIWHEREEELWGGPHFARQTWNEGTDLAKLATMGQAVSGLRGKLTLVEEAVDGLIAVLV